MVGEPFGTATKVPQLVDSDNIGGMGNVEREAYDGCMIISPVIAGATTTTGATITVTIIIIIIEFLYGVCENNGTTNSNGYYCVIL